MNILIDSFIAENPLLGHTIEVNVYFDDVAGILYSECFYFGTATTYPEPASVNEDGWSTSNPRFGGNVLLSKCIENNLYQLNDASAAPFAEITFITYNAESCINEGLGCDLVILTIEKTNQQVIGVSDGTITVTASSTNTPIEYQIEDGGAWFLSGVFTGVATGFYKVSVKDALGCVQSQNVRIEAVPDDLLISTPSMDIGDGLKSLWSAVFNPIVFKYQRRDFRISSVSFVGSEFVVEIAEYMSEELIAKIAGKKIYLKYGNYEFTKIAKSIVCVASVTTIKFLGVENIAAGASPSGFVNMFGYKVGHRFLTEITTRKIRFGGRNLLSNSGTEFINNAGSGLDAYLVVKAFGLVSLEAGKSYRLSIDMKLDSDSSFKLYFYTEKRNGLQYSEYYSETVCDYSHLYKRYSANLTVTASGDAQVSILLDNPNGVTIDAGIAFAKNAKLEQGNKATDWTPAPEDGIPNPVLSKITTKHTANPKDAIVRADIGGYLKASLNAQDNFQHNVSSWVDRDRGVEYSVRYKEAWDADDDISWVEIEGSFYATYSALQIQNGFGSNMAKYVPTLRNILTTSDDVVRFLTNFKTVERYEGMPFDLTFIRSEFLTVSDCRTTEQCYDINGNYLGMSNAQGRSIVSQTGVHRVQVGDSYPDGTDYTLFTITVWGAPNPFMEVKKIFVKPQPTETCGGYRYLKFINTLGGWDYVLFDYKHESFVEVDEVVEFDTFIDDYETTQGGREVMSKTASVKYTVGKNQISTETAKALLGILYSPRVQVLTSLNPIKWQTVLVTTKSGAITDDSKNEVVDFEMSYLMPEVNIQTQ